MISLPSDVSTVMFAGCNDTEPEERDEQHLGRMEQIGEYFLFWMYSHGKRAVGDWPIIGSGITSGKQSIHLSNIRATLKTV